MKQMAGELREFSNYCSQGVYGSIKIVVGIEITSYDVEIFSVDFNWFIGHWGFQ